MEKYMIVLAVLADLIIGKTSSKKYAYVMIGRVAVMLEERLWNENDTPIKQRKKGVILVSGTILFGYAAAIALAVALLILGPWWYFLGSIIVVAFLIMPRSLSEITYEIGRALREGNLIEARRSLAAIIDHDTDMMGREELLRAAIDAIADKLVRNVISPLFYFLLGGFPLAVMYYTANMISSLYSTQNEKYAEFGYAVEKLSEVFNYIPARITALLTVAASFVLRYDTKHSVMMIRRDSNKYPSPNGGYTEAAIAGALNIRLGGTIRLNGKEQAREYIGDAVEQISEEHIEKAIRLLYTVVILFCLIGVVIKIMGGGI